jgi:hypothetical protein
MRRSHSACLIAVQPLFSTFYCKTLNIFIKVCYSLPVVAAMLPRRLLDPFSSPRRRPTWSYHHTGTLPRLISFACHSYENTWGHCFRRALRASRSVGVFFTFRNASIPLRSRRHVTKSPSPQLLYFPHLQNRDARNSFRFCSYAKWGVTSFKPNIIPLPSPAVFTRNFFALISFADPHLLTLSESYRFKNRGGRGLPRLFLLPATHCPLSTTHSSSKPFTCNNSGPQVLLLSKFKAPINLAESTLLQVLILKQLKVPLESITFEKQGGGAPLWLTKY